MSSEATSIKIVRMRDDDELVGKMSAEVRASLSANPKTLPSKYFYDERGSQLFDEITRLPEYYPTRVETSILEEHSDDIVGLVKPDEMIELGAGYSRKTHLLLSAMESLSTTVRLVALDVSEDAIRDAAHRLNAEHEHVEVEGVVGDFERDLPRLERRGTRLIAFLGSTLGNLPPAKRSTFFRSVAAAMEPGDAFLLGFDLVKGRDVLEAAYDDAAGVTAAFNKNILNVLNENLGSSFDLERFDHVAVWDETHERVEMHLRARAAMSVAIPASEIEVVLDEGETIRTEMSCKFRREGITNELSEAGLKVARFMTDPRERFAMVLATR